MTVSTMRRDVIANARKDYGANYFGDFTHLLTLNISTFQNTALVGFWAVNNGNLTYQDMQDADDGLSLSVYYLTATGYRIQIYDHSDSTTDYYDTTKGLYYLIITRKGTAFRVLIYSDSTRTTLLDTLTLTVPTTQFRYCVICFSRESTTSSITGSGYCEFLYFIYAFSYDLSETLILTDSNFLEKEKGYSTLNTFSFSDSLLLGRESFFGSSENPTFSDSSSLLSEISYVVSVYSFLESLSSSSVLYVYYEYPFTWELIGVCAFIFALIALILAIAMRA